MKRLFYTFVLACLSVSVYSQDYTDTQMRFFTLKSKVEYSNKYCTAGNLLTLCACESVSKDGVCVVSGSWLYGAIVFSSKARTNEVFKEYAKRASYTQVSALINEYREFQNDACYTVYLNMNPDQIDISWLKLQVKDTALSHVFANR